MIDNDLLLFIEPKEEPSKMPIVDDITKKMTKYLRLGIYGAQEEKENSIKIENKPPTMIIEMPWNKKYNFRTNTGWMGFHQCSCGVYSEASNYLLPSGDIVNSLCVHYLAFHREEVPQWQIDVIEKISFYETDKNIYPTDNELQWPSKKIENKRFMTRQEYLESVEKNANILL